MTLQSLVLLQPRLSLISLCYQRIPRRLLQFISRVIDVSASAHCNLLPYESVCLWSVWFVTVQDNEIVIDGLDLRMHCMTNVTIFAYSNPYASDGDKIFGHPRIGATFNVPPALTLDLYCIKTNSTYERKWSHGHKSTLNLLHNDNQALLQPLATFGVTLPNSLMQQFRCAAHFIIRIQLHNLVIFIEPNI